jgi:arylsulfatase A-like enzyme
VRRFRPPQTPRNLLVVSLDTLRADHLGCYGDAGAGTPRLDALARSGLRFETATTVVPLTLPAHSSLMTGTFPAWHGVRDNGGFYLGDEQETLAEVLRGRGFRTGGFVGAFVLDRRWGIGQGFDRYFDDFDLDAFANAASMDAIQRPGAEVVAAALDWLRADRDRPFFAWVHLYDPHTPYDAPEPTARGFPRLSSGTTPRSRPPMPRWGASWTPWRPTAASPRPWSWWWATTGRCWANAASRPTASSSTSPRPASR